MWGSLLYKDIRARFSDIFRKNDTLRKI